jgi:N12 class adenine-specific DNA methylase/adenine-specific DNA methylase
MFRQLAEAAALRAIANRESWENVLKTTARLYKYPFPDQLLIHAQRPDATACAEYSFWNEKMGRYVKRGSKGIALIDETGGKPRLRYVFDVSDTGCRQNSRSSFLWKVKDEHIDIVSAMLEREFDVPVNRGLAGQLVNIAALLADEYWQDNQHDILISLDGTPLEAYDESIVNALFQDAMTASVSYVLLARCGLEARISEDAFLSICNFNTHLAVNTFGTAISDISRQVLRQIERTIKKYERDQIAERGNEYGTHGEQSFLRTSRGLPDSRAEDRGDGQADRQVRQDAQDISQGTSSGNVQQSFVHTEIIPAPAGDRSGSGKPADTAHAGVGEGGGCDGGNESERPDALGGPHEQLQGAGRGNHPEGAYLQLNLFPSEQEQIRIAESMKPSAFSLPFTHSEATDEQLSFDSSFTVSQRVIDEALCLGGNEPNSLERICAWFSKDYPPEQNAAFLQKEYGESGKGFFFGTVRYAVWFDKQGIRIAMGRTARTTGTLLMWEDAAQRFRELLDAGCFAPQSVLDRAADDERKELAHFLWYMVSDFSEEAHDAKLIPFILEIYKTREGFPKNIADIQELLKDSEKVTALISEVQEFQARYVENHDLMRFRPKHMNEILTGLNGLLRPALTFKVDPDFQGNTKQLISEDEIDQLLIRSGTVVDQKYHIYSYFKNGHTAKERADFLKHEYGTGGSSRLGFSENHDSKGISYSRGAIEPILVKWSEAEKRIGELIRQGRYLSEEEQASLPTIETHEPSPDAFTVEEDEDDQDVLDDVDPAEIRERLAQSGIVNGVLVDENAQDHDPFIRQVVADAERVAPAQDILQQNESPAANFRITDDRLGNGSAKEKYEYNVAVIRTLKNIESAQRTATSEEQETLSRYVGWGGLADCFDERHSKYHELKALLTEDEYNMARASTLNAHYTSPIVIRAIYEALARMGFISGNILEPACGVGNFFGMLPERMADSTLYGVELDSITGRTAKLLYPLANIAVSGYEKTALPDSFFDLAIGNVPFGSYKLSDKRYDKYNFLIHDYFFAKALDQVRPGGIVAFITSKGTMDKRNPEVRRYLAERAELLGAVRLPNNAFKANAGTEVTSDILFLQKRDRPIDIEPDWVHLGETENSIPVNSYFVEHPEMVLGIMAWESGPHGMETTCVPVEGADLAAQLQEALSHIEGRITEAELPDLGVGEEIDTSIPADPTVRNFSYTLVDGEVYYRENSRMVRPELNATAKERVIGMIGLRDCVHTLMDYQLEDYPDEAIQEKQAELNALYDSFSVKYGLINARGNSLAFSNDSSYFLLCSLEELDEEGKLKRKADMFTKRTIKKQRVVTAVDTASEALAVSISEKACVDLPYMTALSGKTEEQLIGELKGVIFLNIRSANRPNQTYVTADEYLSGNVRDKHKLARAAKETLGDSSLDVNIEALEAVQPKDLEASEIDVRLGATWIGQEYIQRFMTELFQLPKYLQSTIETKYFAYTAEWKITNKNALPYNNVAARVTYGTERATGCHILEDTLNLRDVRVYDTVLDPDGKERRVLNSKETTLAQQKQQAIKDAFRDWIWKDPERRHTLVRTYNDRFNSIRPREYDGKHIGFAGMNPEITLQAHQINAVARQIYGGNTLLGHKVGAGKTYEMIASAMEQKRLGLCEKSLVVVPNHLTGQWAADFLTLYPRANVLVATNKDFETCNRKKFCARIATGEYDAVIIGHSQFERIPISFERQEKLLQEQIDEITTGISEAKSSGGERFTIKQLERTRKGLEAKLEKLHNRERKDDVVTFEQLGVDRLFVDEAHNYKNLFLFTKMRNVAGLSASDAQKSSDMFAKCRYMDELTFRHGVIFATGTPVNNSMTEIYTMQRYLQYDTLVRLGFVHFDAWASTFGETVTTIELAPEGTGYRARTRFARFYNLPELMSIFKEVADIKTADQLNLPVPKANYHTIVAKPTEHQKNMVTELSKRAARIHAGNVDPHEDNMLRVTSDGRKLGLDQRIINPLLPDDPESKVNLCLDNIFRIWKKGQPQKLTQLAFCDISTPQGRAKKKAITTEEPAQEEETVSEPFTVYEDIRSKLIARGIPAEQIAFIHDANTEVKKAELFGKVRSGQVRVLLGSTFKMGAGTNVQDRLIAGHDLDCPWRPGDLEQRAGRTVRQGNLNPEVDIYRYVTDGTFDAYLWQTIENKQRFISQIMTSKSPVRSCEDVDEAALSYAEIKALCAGNPFIKEKMDLDIEVARLRLLKAEHQSQQYRLEDAILKKYPEDVERDKQYIRGYEADLKMLDEHPHPAEGFAGMVVLGVTHPDKETAGQALLEACKAAKERGFDAGWYRGFKMNLEFDSFSSQYKLTLKGSMSHTAVLGTDARGNLTRIENQLAQIPERIKSVQARLDSLYVQMDTAKAELGQPFLQETMLAQKSARLAELNLLLKIDKAEQEIIPLDEGEQPEEPVEEKEAVRDER